MQQHMDLIDYSSAAESHSAALKRINISHASTASMHTTSMKVIAKRQFGDDLESKQEKKITVKKGLIMIISKFSDFLVLEAVFRRLFSDQSLFLKMHSIQLH